MSTLKNRKMSSSSANLDGRGGALSPPTGCARVLSYNFNLLPNCISFSNAHYAEERVSEFASRVGSKFDILALQEVFASALVPVAAREYWCNQHQLIHLLSEPQRSEDRGVNNNNTSNNNLSNQQSTPSNGGGQSKNDVAQQMGEDIPLSPLKRTPNQSGFLPPLYPYVVKARQPSFLRMTRNTIITDSGLLILSKFPIVDSGSMYFRSAQHWRRQLAPKGCLFAKIRLAEDVYIIVVNVHLSSSSTAEEISSDGQVTQTVSEQLKEMRHFIETIRSEHPNCPLMITGDFNINSIAQQDAVKKVVNALGRSTPPPAVDSVSGTGEARGTGEDGSDEPPLGEVGIVETEAYRQLTATMRGVSHDVREVLKDSCHHHPPTRPATLTFPSFLNRMQATRFPQRHDYCFFTNGDASTDACITLGHTRLQRFTASSQRPYMYLSDHFGISIVLNNSRINLQKALQLEGDKIYDKPSRSWIYPLLKHARSVSRKDFSNGWERYFESAFFDSVFKVVGYIFFPLLVYYLLAGFPALRYVAAMVVAALTANHVFGNKVMAEMQESEFGAVDKKVTTGKAPVAATKNAVGALGATVASPPKCIWDMWVRSVNDFGWQPCIGFRHSELDAKWLTFLDVDKQVRALGSALKGLKARPGSVIGVLMDSHHLNPIIDLACQGYGYICLPLVADIKISRNIIDSNDCKICICTRKYTPKLLLARSRQLTCVVQVEEIGSHEYDMARGASIDLRGYEKLITERQSHGALDRPACEEAAAAVAAAAFEAAASSPGRGGRTSSDRGAAEGDTHEFSAAVATFVIGDEEEVNRTVIPLTRKEVVRSVIAAMETNLVQDRRAHPNRAARTDPTSAKIFGILAPFSNGFNRTLALAVLASGHQLAMCEDSSPSGIDLRTLRPDVLVCSRSFLTLVQSRLSTIESRYCWLRHMLFRWAYQFRSRLLRHSQRDSSSLRSLFFGANFAQKIMRARDVDVQRIIAESPSISIPYRVKEMAMVCITPVVRECVVDAYGRLVAVDGTPPPRTFVNLEPLNTDGPRGAEGADEMAGGVSVLRIGAGVCATLPQRASGKVGDIEGHGGDQWCDTKLVAIWKQDRRLQFLGAKADLLWPLGNVVAVATELEALYRRACPMIQNIFITCDHERPLLAVIVPHRDVVEDMLEQRISNWADFTQQATPVIMEALTRTAATNELPKAHYIELIHIHPHPFTVHDDFVSPSGGLRRTKIREYFRTSISRLYTGRVANGGGGLTSAAGNEDEIPQTPTMDGALHSFAAIGQQSTYTTRRDKYAGPQASTPIAIDIGGTCAKLVFLQPPNAPKLPSFCQLAKVEASFALPKNIRFFKDQEGAKNDPNAGELRFVQCSTHDVPAMIQFIADSKLCDSYREGGLRYVPATGGGAFRFAPLVESQLGVRLTQLKEMDSIIAGINFILRHAPELTFTFDLAASRRVPCVDPSISTSTGSTPQLMAQDRRQHRQPTKAAREAKDAFTASFFPYLLVNIGSGVSMIKCTSETEGDFVRVGGSLIGGGTFWGLVRSMTNLRSWDEINEMTRIDGPGDNTNVDLLVGDIYGYNATSLPGNLHVDIIASTFGKIGADRGEQYVDGAAGPNGYGASGQESSGRREDDPEDRTPPLSSSFRHSRKPSSVNFAGVPSTPVHDDLGDGGHDHQGANVSSSSSGMATGANSRLSAPRQRPEPIDIVRSLVIMMAFNVSQLANLTCQIEGIQTVFFTGGFVRNNPIVHNQLTKALSYWSGGKLQARFLEPDGFVGTLGSLQHQPTVEEDASI